MLEHPEISWAVATGYPSWMQGGFDEDVAYEEARERELFDEDVAYEEARERELFGEV